jgi:hypothetical protein
MDARENVGDPSGYLAQAVAVDGALYLFAEFDAGLHQMLLTTLGLTAATAQLQGATLRCSAIPGAYPLPYGFDFSASTMRPLLHYAYECARAGRLWATFQSSDDHRRNDRGIAVVFPRNPPRSVGL